MRTKSFLATAAASLLLAACGGEAAPSTAPGSSAPPPAALAGAAKPASAAPASAAASAKPAASGGAASASAKPAASGAVAASGAASKPAAAPKPTATTLPVVDADTTKLQLTKVPIPPATGKTFSADILEIDQATHRLYVTDRTDGGISIFDTSASPAKYITTVKTKGDPNGITIAKNVNKVFFGEGNNGQPATADGQSTIGIMDISDPNGGKILAEVSSGGKKRADETDYDPNTKRGMVANSDDQLVSIVDLTNNTIAKKIDLPGGALEQPRYNPADKFMYLTGSEDNVIYQFDMNNMSMTKKMDVGDKCNPNGIAINPTLNIAVLVCSSTQNQHLAVWDFKTSKVTSTIDKAGAGDGGIYDAKADKFIITAANYYRGGQMAFLSGDGKFITNVPTAVGSHGVAYDEATNTVYTQDQLPNEGVLFSFQIPNK